MSDNINQAVAYLNDLLELARTTTSAVDQATLDAVVDELAPDALEEVQRFKDQLAADEEAADDAVTQARAQAERQGFVDAEAAAQALVQDEEDEAQRVERLAAGVS